MSKTNAQATASPDRRGGSPPSLRARIGVVAILAFALLASYWPVFRSLYRDWHDDANYSVGALVLPLAVVFFVRAAGRVRGALTPSWWGLGLLATGQLMRLLGVLLLYESIERYSIIVTCAGLVLFVGGWTLLRHSAASLLFLALMVPFPNPVHNAIALPLQDVAATGAEQLLELIGLTVTRDGYDLRVGAAAVAVAEGCSGLRMLMATLFLTAVLALLIRRPAWQKLALLILGVPIAVATNIVRLVATAGWAWMTNTTQAAQWGHDLGGVAMIPLAFAMLLAAVFLLDRVFVTLPAAVADGDQADGAN